MREKKQQQQIPFHKKCPKVSWPTNRRASFRTPFLLLTIRSAQAQRLQPLTPEMCVKLTSYQTNMQEEYGSPARWIQRRGPGSRAQTEARRAENLFLRPDPHPSRSVWPAPHVSSLSEGLDLLLKQNDFYYKVNKIMSSCQKLLCVSFGKYWSFTFFDIKSGNVD